MKVGDLVRHSMYSDEKFAAIVIKVSDSRGHILILDQGDVYWDRMSYYEVVSESR